jgi:hypothetical protein
MRRVSKLRNRQDGRPLDYNPFKRGASTKKTPARLYTHTTGPLILNGEPTGQLVTSVNKPWKVDGRIVDPFKKS